MSIRRTRSAIAAGVSRAFNALRASASWGRFIELVGPSFVFGGFGIEMVDALF